MSQDAIPAYDQVIYVGADQVLAPVPEKLETPPAAVEVVRAAPKKTVAKTAPVKAAAPKAAATKKAAVKNVVKKSAGKTVEAVTSPQTIVSAFPNLQAGQWLELSDIAKILHDKKLLAKSATSTKLFKKFPEHFELRPAGKPNKVRLIKL